MYRLRSAHDGSRCRQFNCRHDQEIHGVTSFRPFRCVILPATSSLFAIGLYARLSLAYPCSISYVLRHTELHLSQQHPSVIRR